MKGVVVLFLLLLIPLAYSISIRELLSRYSFSTITSQMNVTNIYDFMADKNNNGINDTLVFELTTSNTAGNFVFVISLFDKNGVLANETNKTISSGANKLNITFDSILLSQSQFNYSIKIYNSTYGLKYRKDKMLTQTYQNYEEGFRILDIKDLNADKTLRINATINSSINGTFETILFLSYNNSIISAKKNISITSTIQDLIFDFDSETIKRTHYAGTFNISSLKIGKKPIKTNLSTSIYDFRDFAADSFIAYFSDSGVDTDNDGKSDLLRISASLQIVDSGAYSMSLALYDLFGNLVEIKNITSSLSAGANTVQANFNGSKIYGKKLNGPFIVKNAELFKNGALTDKMSDAYTTGNYNFNDFGSPSLPDLIAGISVSDGYLYGIENITVNFTIKNIGNSPAFNVFAEMFDNRTFSKANKSSIINMNSQATYQIEFKNISDFEITAIADINDFVEEINESNNAKKLAIKLNKKPVLSSVNNITVNETDKITINLSAYDQNSDELLFLINLSQFSNKSNVFEWKTTTKDSGNYTLMAVASDGYLNDTRIFNVAVLDAPEKDSDNDGIEEDADNLVGDENSVNTSTLNISILVDDSKNLSRILNKSMKVRLKDSNLTVVDFDFDFSLHRLNLTNLTIDKQSSNATGSLLVRGLKLPEGAVKALYVDRLNQAINGVCIKDEEIPSIDEISSDCSSSNEFQVECDGTLQDSYTCAYNSTLNKYKIEGLRHSGIVQIAYTKPASSSGSSSASSAGSGSGGGGNGIICISDWQCSEWAKCLNGFRTKKCSDSNKCAFPGSKPIESEKCAYEKEKAGAIKHEYADRINRINESIPKKFSGITGQAVKPFDKKPDFGIFIVFAEILLIQRVPPVSDWWEK